MKLGKIELYKFIFFNGLFLTFVLLEKCIGAEITSNIDGQVCPGEEVVYTCTSEGTSQRWRLSTSNRGVLADHTYVQGQQPGRVDVKPPCTFVLVSAEQGQIKSTVSVLATASIHNTVVECIGITSRASTTIGIAGIPASPTTLRSDIIYYDYFSTVLFTWNAPNDNSRVDYYQYRVENGTYSFAYNTSNSTATLSGIIYNQNTTFSVLSLNCIGESAPLSQTIYIVGCREFDYLSFNVSHSAFSQAPGTQIILSCDALSLSGSVITTCESDGTWEPDPETSPCAIDSTTTTKNYTTVSISDVSEILDIGANPPKQTIALFLIPVYVFGAIGLCTLAVFASGYIILKLRFIRKQRKENFTLNEVNQTYYEVIDPIYDTIPTTESETSTPDNVGITTMSNDAYNNIHSWETKCCQGPAPDFNTSSNEAYAPSTSEKLVSMQSNSSYQAAAPLQVINPMTTVADSESEGSTQKTSMF